MGAALSLGKWYSLVSLDGLRFCDLPLGFPSEEEARWACYASLETHTRMKRASGNGKNACFSGKDSLPKFEDLVWVFPANPQNWLDSYFRKPVWPLKTRVATATSSGFHAGSADNS